VIDGTVICGDIIPANLREAMDEADRLRAGCQARSRGGGSVGDHPRKCVRVSGHAGYHVALDDGENIPTVWSP